MRNSDQQRSLLGQRGTTAFIVLLVLAALALLATGVWLTLHGDAALWYGDVPVP